jgi:hypothetical protein
MCREVRGRAFQVRSVSRALSVCSIVCAMPAVQPLARPHTTSRRARLRICTLDTSHSAQQHGSARTRKGKHGSAARAGLNIGTTPQPRARQARLGSKHRHVNAYVETTWQPRESEKKPAEERERDRSEGPVQNRQSSTRSRALSRGIARPQVKPSRRSELSTDQQPAIECGNAPTPKLALDATE